MDDTPMGLMKNTLSHRNPVFPNFSIWQSRPLSTLLWAARGGGEGVDGEPPAPDSVQWVYIKSWRGGYEQDVWA